MSSKKMPSERSIILVDDEPAILFGTSVLLRQAGIENVVTLDDSRKLLPLIAATPPSVVVLDLQMPYLSGRDLLGMVASEYPQIPVIIVTAASELDTAVDCMRKGAFDYLVKPISAERFVSCIHRAMELNALRTEIALLREENSFCNICDAEVFSRFTTGNEKMKSLFRYLEAVATTDQPVLITGETGTGKELVARAVHDLSGRKGEFVAVNSAGLDDLMFADTLFGHVKGAFTGAQQIREGMIVKAAGGTLFLDEIGDMSQASQVKLLRLLQEGEFYPLGSDTKQVNRARIVVATHCSLEEMISSGSFRRDLYYRLCSHKAQVPALRNRFDDIPLLLDRFITEAADTMNKSKPSYPPELISYLKSYHFPGNVRELRAMVFDAMARYQKGQLSMVAFRESIARISSADICVSGSDTSFFDPSGKFPTLKEAEEFLVSSALSRSGGNQRAAAELLGISRQALNQRLSKK